MSRTKLIREWQQHGALTTLRRVTGLGAIALLLSGCSAAQHVSQGEPAIERSGLREPLPFTRLTPRTYTPDEWPQALTADVYLPMSPATHCVLLPWWFMAAAGATAHRKICRASLNS